MVPRITDYFRPSRLINYHLLAQNSPTLSNSVTEVWEIPNGVVIPIIFQLCKVFLWSDDAPRGVLLTKLSKVLKQSSVDI